MSNQEDTKTRLAGEIMKIVFGYGDVPASAWAKVDAVVKESFSDWSEKRLQGLIDDVSKMRACCDDCDAADIDGPSGISTDIDWAALSCVVNDCQKMLGCPRDHARPAPSPLDDWFDEPSEYSLDNGMNIEELDDDDDIGEDASDAF